MSLDAFLKAHKLPDSYKESAQKWFTPIVNMIVSHQKSASGPFTLGIQGCQGSGKSTLADYLAHQLKAEANLNVIVCSLDDFYLSRNKRVALAKKVHPMLQTRGVPGTHDTELLEHVLLHVNQANTLSPLTVPRFDKSTDDPHPRKEWPVYGMPIDVLILEGWCWGLPAQNDIELVEPVNTLEAEDDPNGEWRRYVNSQLLSEYQPLYGLVDEWVLLKAPSFEQVAEWREEQEAKLRAKFSDDPPKNIMTPDQVRHFISYFQRLTEHALNVMPNRCNWVFELDKSRTITHCKQKNGAFS
jgi:D-glycerate 3-kinase